MSGDGCDGLSGSRDEGNLNMYFMYSFSRLQCQPGRALMMKQVLARALYDSTSKSPRRPGIFGNPLHATKKCGFGAKDACTMYL